MVKSMAKNFKINLTEIGIIQVHGKESKNFLQGQLTCDVEEVDENQTRLGAHCDAKGRVQATFRLFLYQDDYYLIMPRNMVKHLLQCFQKYAVFSAVSLHDVTPQWKIIGLIGDSSADLLKQDTLFIQQKNGFSVSSNYVIICMPGPTPRFILLSPTKKSTCLINTLAELTLDDWYLQDILVGVASIYPETTAQFTPHQLNYPAIGGVSFKKGCYIGQEIIARTHYLGQSKTGLYRVGFETKLQFVPGTVIQNEKGVRQGTLLMLAKKNQNRYEALVCLQNQAISHSIYLESPRGPVLEILKLPNIA